MRAILFLLLVFPLFSLWAEEWAPGSLTSHTSEGEFNITYHVYLPTTFDEKDPPPMIIVFSPGGNGQGILNAYKGAAEKMGWTVVGADHLRNSMKDPQEGDKEEEVFESILAKVPHHPRRIYLGGFSGGALRAYKLTAKYNKSPIAGVIAMGGWLGGKYDLKFRKYMSVVQINGTTDRGANSYTEKDKEALEDRRIHVKTIIFEGGHRNAPEASVVEAMEWLEEEWEDYGSRKQKS